MASESMQQLLSKDKNEILQSLIADVTNKYKELKMKHENIETEHSNAIEQLQQQLSDQYESQINALSHQLSTLQSKYDTLQVEHDDIQQITINLQTKNTSLHEKIHKQDQELAHIKEQLNETRIELQSQISEYKLSYNTQSIMIDDLKQKLDIALNTSQRRSSGSMFRKDLNRTLRVHFLDQNKTPSISERSNQRDTNSSLPKLSLVSTTALSVEFCICDKGGSSEVSILPSEGSPGPLMVNHDSNNTVPTPYLTKRRIASRSVYNPGMTPTDKVLTKHSLNYGGSAQLSANSYFEPLIKSETELTCLSIDIEEDDIQEIIQVIAN